MQSHYVNYDQAPELGEWTGIFPGADCAEGVAAGSGKACFTADAYFREMFVRSDTSMAILSALPSPGGTGLDSDDMVYAIDVATRIGCNGRVLMHGGAYPHRGPIGAALEGMTEARDKYDIVAWKIYTMVPTEAHFFFDDHDKSRPQIGQRFIDHVREIGPKIICTHKGISSIVGSTPELADPSDMGPAAKRNPDVNFVVYHSGFEPGGGGVGPYDANDPAPQGVDRLIRSLEQAGIEPNSNVYAELGGTWWFLMREPTAAAHVLGKLLKFVGDGAGALGHRLDLVRDAAGSDPGHAHIPDRRGAARRARLSEADPRDQGGHLRAQRGRALRHRADHRAMRSVVERHREGASDAAPGDNVRAGDRGRSGAHDRRPPGRLLCSRHST